MYIINKQKNKYITLIISIILLLTACSTDSTTDLGTMPSKTIENDVRTPEANATLPYNIPPYAGAANIPVNNDVPFFTENDFTTDPFEYYSNLDNLGRCGTAYANVCTELMPTEPRGDINEITPTGWVQKNYPSIIDDEWLYNRCHLIGFQLTGENTNEKNLITGTRYLNIDGMLGLENSIADYIQINPDNHILYRVTPVFLNNELLCRGLLIEAISVEDRGKELQFCRFAYNVQPGIEIDYTTGNSQIKEE